MILVLACILLVLLIALPFIPGTHEILRKRDAKPLYIDIDYRKDPRYFALSFRRLFLDSLGVPSEVEEFRAITLSKEEKAQLIRKGLFVSGTVVENILYVMQDLDSEADVTFKKEVYVRGGARIGEDNQLQALACDGDVHLRRGVKFFRWLDAEGSITAEGPCVLGVEATCGGVLFLAQQCLLMRLYGFPVTTAADPVLLEQSEETDRDTGVFEEDPPERDRSTIHALSRINHSIISKKSLTIGEYSVIRGHVKTHGDLVIGAHVIITGNIFAEGSIQIGPRSHALGTVFSQDHILLKQGARVGARNRIKSVIGKKGIMIEDSVRVYGYVMTEGKGFVV